MASDGLLWPLMASDGLWWPLIASLIRYDLATEAIRLNPQKKEYLSNRAAAGLKLGLPSKTKRYLRQAAEDSVDAYEIDPSYLKAYLRAAEAHLALNERTTVKLAVHELETALKMDPDNDKIKAQLKDAQLTWEADWAD